MGKDIKLENELHKLFTDSEYQKQEILKRLHNKVEYIDNELKKESDVQYKYPIHSKQYSESLQNEIKLLEQKNLEIKGYTESLERIEKNQKEESKSYEVVLLETVSRIEELLKNNTKNMSVANGEEVATLALAKLIKEKLFGL